MILNSSLRNLCLSFCGMVVVAFWVLTGFAQAHFPAEAPSTIAGETAELQFYGRATQIGVVARRTIRDRSGRLAREVFYTSSAMNMVPLKEEDLRVQSISVYFHDIEGRIDRVEHWQKGSRVPRVEHNGYSSDELIRKWFVEPDGVRRYEMRYSGSKTTTHLYYNDTGTYLTSIRGRLVSDVDLPHGWGNVSGGMSCGITLSSERGRLDDIGVWVNVKNVDEQPITINTLTAPYVELRDSNGRLISLQASAANSQEKYHQLNGQLLEQNEAGFMYPAFKLADYFERIPPGKYTIRVRQPLPERSVELISNDVSFVVL